MKNTIRCKVQVANDGIILHVISADGHQFKMLKDNEFVDLEIIEKVSLDEWIRRSEDSEMK